MRTRQLLRSILPPFLWQMGKNLNQRCHRSVDRIAYAPDGWATRLPHDARPLAAWTAFMARQRLACQALIDRVRAGHTVLSTDVDERVKHLVYGYVLARAARQQQAISVLDYGGNLGDYYWLGRGLLPDVELAYHCKELPEVAEIGRDVSPLVHWHTEDDCLDQPHDLVMFASSLQGQGDWQDVVRRAALGTRHYLLLSDVAPVRLAPSYVVTSREGGATYLRAVLNSAEVRATIEGTGLRLVVEFDMGAYPPVRHAPEQPTCVGWLFQRRK